MVVVDQTEEITVGERRDCGLNMETRFDHDPLAIANTDDRNSWLTLPKDSHQPAVRWASWPYGVFPERQG